MLFKVLMHDRPDEGAFLPGSQRRVGLRNLLEGKVRGPELAPIFALRTTTAALGAFAVAWGFGIYHPWWAAMTVWLVAQPTTGLLFERSLARLIGTGVGALAGAGVLMMLAEQRFGALVAVAAWLALCTGLGSIFRHFRNYGFVLAGYTASIVVLFGLGEATSDAGLALDRVTCTAIGIICSALVSCRSLPDRGTELTRRRQEILNRSLAEVERFLRWGTVGEPGNVLFSDIAALDRSVDEYAAGSLRRQREAWRTRRISGLLLELLTQSAAPGVPGGGNSLACDGPTAKRLTMLIATANAAGRLSIASTLEELQQLLNNESPSPEPLRFEVDPSAVWRAAARPVVALACAATIWWASGWGSGAMMVMTAALFTSLFSSHDQANHMVIQVLLGTLAGAIAGVAVRLVVLPHAEGLWTTLLCIAPFLLAGAWLMQRPATSKMAIDLTMTFLLTSQPSSPPAGVAVALNEAAAIIVGVMIAAATFWAVLPATPAVGSRLLARRIVRLTLRLSASRDAGTAGAVRQSLRRALVRLLDFTKPHSAIFVAAQQCLAVACRAPTPPRDGQTSSRLSPDAAAFVSAARQAAATLRTTIANNAKG